MRKPSVLLLVGMCFCVPAATGAEVSQVAAYPAPLLPSVAITSPTAAATYRTVHSYLGDMRGTVAGVGATGRVFWSVGAIESEVDSYGFGSGVLVGWQIRFVPLEPGPNVIIITVFDSAGQSASTTLTVVREAVGGVLYVDCSSPDAGDGSRGSPLNRLQHAVDQAYPGDIVHLLMGPCSEDVFLNRGVTIRGDPSLPPVTIGDPSTGPGVSPSALRAFTTEPVRMEHLRALSGKSIKFDALYADGVLEDLVDSEVELAAIGPGPGGSLPRIRLVRSSGMQVVSRAGSASLAVEDSNGVLIGLSLAGYEVDLDVIRSGLDGLWISGHGVWDVTIDQSDIRDGPLTISQDLEGAGPLTVSITSSRFAGAPVSIHHSNSGGCYPCSWPDPVRLLLDGNEFADSPVTVNLSDYAHPADAPPFEVRIVNNVSTGGGVHVGLSRFMSLRESPAGIRVLNNTFVGAPAGVSLTAESADSPLPDWLAELTNNIVTGGGTGIAVTGAGLFDLSVAHNDLFSNQSTDYGGDLPDLAGVNGNISLDPTFTDPAAGDYSLLPASPCVDAGAASSSVPAADHVGVPRPQDGDGDGLAKPDIGAFEFVPGHADGDGDGYAGELDCDDADPAVNPSAIELPGNDADENCDRRLACEPGGAWLSHGRFVRCVARECASLVGQGLVTPGQCSDLLSSAARRSAGR